MKWNEMLIYQSCSTLCNPMGCSPPVSSVHGILQARILEWIAIPFSRRSSWTRNQTWISWIAGRFFIAWTIREAHLSMCITIHILECEVKWVLQSIATNKASWAISDPERWCCESAALNTPANLENSAVATGLKRVSFHSNPKERQSQRMLKLPHNCTHLTC